MAQNLHPYKDMKLSFDVQFQQEESQENLFSKRKIIIPHNDGRKIEILSTISYKSRDIYWKIK